MTGFDDIGLSWADDRTIACTRIAGRPATFKILLKSKNDPFFLKRWVAHHAKIVGLQNLIIFDNMSDDPDVLSFYRTHAKDLLVIRFSDFHDNLHDTVLFPDLYAALESGCEYFIFLDTDEFLILLDGHRHQQSVGLQHVIASHPGTDVFPATWLLNAAGSATRFLVGADMERLNHGLTWGKPIIRSRAGARGFINHNSQIEKWLFQSGIVTRFFVLHMVQLSAKQRVAANFQKLVANGFAAVTDRLQDLVERDMSRITHRNTLLYVSEIARLLPLVSEPVPAADDACSAGCLHLRPDGTVRYDSAVEEALFMNFLTRGDEIARSILNI
jgi:hypothetical protein